MPINQIKNNVIILNWSSTCKCYYYKKFATLLSNVVTSLDTIFGEEKLIDNTQAICNV